MSKRRFEDLSYNELVDYDNKFQITLGELWRQYHGMMSVVGYCEKCKENHEELFAARKQDVIDYLYEVKDIMSLYKGRKNVPDNTTLLQ